MMTPVPKCFAAKKMLRNVFLDMNDEDARGRQTPIALEMRTTLGRGSGQHRTMML